MNNFCAFDCQAEKNSLFTHKYFVVFFGSTATTEVSTREKLILFQNKNIAMAKTKKNIKNNIAQKKSAKGKKRKELLRKKKNTAPLQKKASYADVKKSLAHLPKLIFEPEITDVSFDTNHFVETRELFEDEPSQIKQLFTSEIVQRLEAAFIAMGEREEIRADKQKRLNLMLIQHFMEKNTLAVYFNPLFIAKFFYEKQKITREGEAVTIENVSQIVQDFEVRWKDRLEEEQSKTGSQSDELSTDSGGDLADFTDFKQAILDHYEQNPVDGFDLEDGDADLEAFLNDYLPEAGITASIDIQASHIKRFFGWFVRNMNPTPEDTEKMTISLKMMVDFIAQKGEHSAESVLAMQELEVLKNKEKQQ